MIRFLLWLAVFVSLVHSACSSPLQPPDGVGTEDVSTALGRMEQALADVKTVRTRFVQEQTLVLFKNKLITRGSILVEPPSKLLWRVESPIEYVLAMDGKIAKQWDGETGKTQTISLEKNPVFSAVAEQLSSWFGGHYQQLAKDYTISQKSEAPPIFEFIPKPDAVPAKMLESVTVSFRADGRYIESIQIDSIGGDSTVLKFEETEINVPLTSGDWDL